MTAKRDIEALILRGGGVKGLAFVGALLELEHFFSFKTFVGASAGAITALLLGAGYRPKELEEKLRDTDFAKFLDAGWPRSIWNLVSRKGLYPGNAIRAWMHGLLAEKISRADRIPMSALPGHTIVYAAGADRGTIIFDSTGSNGDCDADFAARCSMSIPYFFVPQEMNGHRVVDGGLLNNLPVQIYLEKNPGSSFLALYLGSESPKLVLGNPSYSRSSTFFWIATIEGLSLNTRNGPSSSILRLLERWTSIFRRSRRIIWFCKDELQRCGSSTRLSDRSN